MDWTHESFISPSCPPLSVSNDRIILETSSNHSNPLHTPSNRSTNTQSLDGLGILPSGSETTVEQTRRCPPLELYTAVSATRWSNQLTPSTMSLKLSLDTSHLSPETCYEPYSSQSDVSASPLSFCGPLVMNASPSHESGWTFGGNQDLLGNYAPQFWPNSSFSGEDIQVKEDPDTKIQDTGILGDVTWTSYPTVTPIAPFVVNNEYGKLESFDGVSGGILDTSQCMELPAIPVEIISAGGLECNICGTRFTRRSNCQEHIKRHDPTRKRSHDCDICGRSFGRKTDLKRHIDSVHRRLLKFGCDQCGHRFSRHDTLVRHKTDGCGQRVRRPKSSGGAASPSSWTPVQDSPKSMSEACGRPKQQEIQ